MQRFRGENQMENLKVSIIIPVYKVEMYICQCIDSILEQTYRNIEVILVDDGSPDSCPMICDEYEKKDDRVIVVHKDNGGLSEARNSGIRKATGEYVMFVDSDDFFDDLQAIERIMERVEITKPDVLNYSYKKYYEKSNIAILQFENKQARPIELETKEKQLDFLTKNHLYIASACNKLIRSEILSEKMLFEQDRLSEDVEWCARLMLYANSFDFICENFYCYRQRSGSIAHSIDENHCGDLQRGIMKCVSIAKKAKEELQTYIYRYAAYQYATFIAVQAIATKCPIKCIKELSVYKWLLTYHANDKKVLCLNYACKIIGFQNTCRIVRWTKSIWDKWRMKK